MGAGHQGAGHQSRLAWDGRRYFLTVDMRTLIRMTGSVNFVNLALSALRPLILRKRRNSGHRRKSQTCQCTQAAVSNRSKTARYSITSSARSRNESGIVRPSALAVVRLTTISNLDGCSTGMSPGFVPRRILSTNSAARRN
jgi:hypothetical protein